MNNPIAVFQRLREIYLRYLDSPLAIRYDSLRDERRALLDEDRRMWREPLIEPTPVYPTSGGDFPRLRTRCWTGRGATRWQAKSLIFSAHRFFLIIGNHTCINAKHSSEPLLIIETWS